MYEKHLDTLKKELPVGESFDLLERRIKIGGRKATIFYVDGLTDGLKAQYVLNYLLSIEDDEMRSIANSQQFIEEKLPFLSSQVTDSYKIAQQRMYSGLSIMVVESLDKIIIIDTRSYPSRSVEEPEKEKSLRGARDGFTESFMQNIGMIRRRIRDNNLILKYFPLGEVSKTDVAVVYMKDKVNKSLLNKVENLINKVKTEYITVGDQSVLEKLMKELKAYNGFNPFPKVRYSQRPDIIAAHITEGKIAIIVDNSPTVMLLPVGVFDFLQDVDDYYFPQLTGNYFRLLRTLNFLVILFLTPIYMLIIQYKEMTPEILEFFVPEKNFAVPILIQFLLLEIAIDGLKLASLNTPSSLGMSLSVIGALILGEFSVNSGWFIPQTILCMAVVALASFTQPSIELSYGMKFSRLLMIIGAGTFGILGFVTGFVIALLVLSTTKTLSGDSYLYPLIPFNWQALKKLLFRCEE
ncbi:MAG: spore germination protein [Firmicutes bacterium]|nr:spore germination protein [Bacillota bacterium]